MTVLARSESRRRPTTCGGCGELARENLRLRAELDDREQAVRAAYTRLVETGDAERRRLERNLHDGAQQRVVAVAIRLRMLALRIAPDPEADRVLAAAQDALAASLRELRDLARGLHPAMLATGGLRFALEDLAARATLPVTIVGDPGRRWFDAATETAAYYLVSESLANISKHARAQAATITVSSDDERLVVE